MAIADQSEEPTGLVVGHGLETHFVDHENGDVEVLAPSQPRGRQFGIGSKGGEPGFFAPDGPQSGASPTDAELSFQMDHPEGEGQF